MLSFRNPSFPLLPAVALVLAAPAAAKVTLALTEPKEPLDPLQVYLFKAVVGGAQDSGVLWSACEAGPPFRVLAPGDRDARFQPDGDHGLARFSARGPGEGVRTFLVRAASREDPSVYACVTVQVKAGPGHGGGAGSRALETKAAGAGGHGGESKAEPAGEVPVIAWATPFSSWIEDQRYFQPMAFGQVDGGPALLGRTLYQYPTEFIKWQGLDGKIHDVFADRGQAPVAHWAFHRLAVLPDGTVVADDRGERIWRVAPGAAAPILDAGWEQAKEQGFRGIRTLAALADGSLAVGEGVDQYRLVRLAPDGTREVLVGLGGNDLRDQDLRKPRPALAVRLKSLSLLRPAPDGSLVFASGVYGGLYSLAPDGVIHPLSGYAIRDCAVTSDNRVVFLTDAGDLRQVAPGGTSILLAKGIGEDQTPQDGRDPGPLVAATAVPIGMIRGLVPAPGGALLVQTSHPDRIWYLAAPGKDRPWSRRLARAREALEAKAYAKAWEVRAELDLLARTGADARGGAPARFAGLARGGLKGLPRGLQSLVDSFLRDPLPAAIAKYVLDRQIEALPEAIREGFRTWKASPPAGAGPEAKGGAKAGESKAGAGDAQ